MKSERTICRLRARIFRFGTLLSAVTISVLATSQRANAQDSCTYPDNSNLPRSGVLFNESTVLRTFDPSGGVTIRSGAGLTIKAFYND